MKTFYRLRQPLLLFLLLLCGTTIKAQFPGWQWAKSIGDTSSYLYTSGIDAIATDVSGNIYVTGSFSNANLVLGTTTLTNTDTQITSDIFIAKYAPNGTLLWARREGSIGRESSYDIIVDPSGNIIIGGEFFGPTLSIGNTVLANTNPSNSTGDLFLAKFDPTGNPLWAIKGGGTERESITKIQTDLNGNIYFAGYFDSPTLTIGNSVLTNIINSASQSSDVFISKCGSSGNILWVERIAGIGRDFCGGLSIDAAGNVYSAGYFGGPALTAGNTTAVASNTNNPAENLYIVKYNSLGTLQWVKTNGPKTSPFGPRLTADGTGNIYVASTYDPPTLVLDNYSLTVPYGNDGNRNIFLSKYDTNGNLTWVRNILSSSALSNPFGIFDDASGNVLICGVAHGGSTSSMTFEPVSVPVHGFMDLFVAKYNPQGTLNWATVEGSGSFEGALCVTADPSGDVIVSGSHLDTLQLGSTTLLGHQRLRTFLAKTGGPATNLREYPSSDALHLFPNPFSSQIYLSTNIRFQDADLVIRNSLGLVVKELHNMNGELHTIPCSELSPGTYFVEISQNGELVAVKKAVKVN